MQVQLIVTTILLILWVLCIILWIKNTITYIYIHKVIDGIFEYNHKEIDRGYCSGDIESIQLISYKCLKSYDRAMFNLFNWGYTSVVPNEILEKIKPYIK